MPLLAALLATLLAATPSARAAELPLDLPQAEYPIPAVLSLPDSATTPAPALLMLHGTASQKNEVGNLYARLAARLAAAGIASLRIDFAGNGDSPVGHERFSLSSAVRDAGTAMAYLRRHPAVDEARIAVLGFSQGALIAQRTVLEHPPTAAIVTWSAVASDGAGGFSAFFRRHREEAQQNGVAMVSFDWLAAPLAFSERWFSEIESQRTLSEMAGYRGPRLAVAGLEDRTIPYSQSIALVAQSHHPASRVLLLAGADHIFNVLDSNPGARSTGSRSDVQLLQETISWLAARLSAPPRSPETWE
jgi:dienelactone hydrolase